MKSFLCIISMCFYCSCVADKVFFVDQTNFGIYHSDIEPGMVLTDQIYQRALFEYIHRPGVMTYDFVTNMVVWGQVSPHKIGGDVLDGVPNKVVIIPGVKPFCITFNNFDRRIYWFGNVSRILASIRLDGTNKIRIDYNDRHIYGLSADGQIGKLYFSEGDRIMEIKVDGTDKEVIVDTDLANVTAFTRNAQDNCLYWINGGQTVERYNLETNVRTALANISILIGYAEHIVVYNDVIYWTDNKRGGIGHLHLTDPTNQDFRTNITVSGTEQSLAGILDMKVFIGEHVDYCSSSPCQEGLICVSDRFEYNCVANNTSNNNNTSNSTDSNNAGRNTTLNSGGLNPCGLRGEDYPCDALRGICHNNNGSALCDCQEEYVLGLDGVMCLVHANCRNCDNGECIEADGIYECICDSGFILAGDERCEDINECQSSVCDPEYGVCVNTKGGYYCTCQTGFITVGDGFTCQVDCTESTCQNNGTCTDNQCFCPDDIEGILCETVDLETDDDDDTETNVSDNYDDPITWQLPRNIIIIITIVVLLIIITSIVIVVVCYRCKRKGKNNEAA
ncbi:low-density lipoprotein receptor-related protein 1-like [Lytechinus pictus]|uniref:low-density lipoprotein receptor-related protein 1-like n=1 Tax=Lytechinus pictus TaxID=7653 RepID=UPI0030B9F1BF